MKTYVILLRGINVGGKNILPMKELVAILEENNYKHIKTYIQSGNVVLKSSNNPSIKIGTIVQNKFGFKPEILVLDEVEFNSSVKNNPYLSKEGKNIHFYFCKTNPKVNSDEMNKLKSETEEYHLNGKVFYLHAPKGVGRSKLVANIETCLGVTATGRNLNTVNKIQSMLKNT